MRKTAGSHFCFYISIGHTHTLKIFILVNFQTNQPSALSISITGANWRQPAKIGVEFFGTIATDSVLEALESIYRIHRLSDAAFPQKEVFELLAAKQGPDGTFEHEAAQKLNEALKTLGREKKV